MLVTPTEIENAAKDITSYFETSKLSKADKVKIMNMVKEFYSDRNEHNVDQWLSKLAEREVIKNSPELEDVIS